MYKLYIVATPIGNLEDISLRAMRILKEVSVIACEDTRKTGFLILHIGAGKKRYISVRDWNEAEMVPKLLQELQDNDVALVSDAGTPLLSDPGFKIVRAAVNAGVCVVPIPGPFAGATAMMAAGLPSNKIMFWGFLPKKWELAPEMTHVIYESPVRADKTLKEIKSRYPTAKIMLALELTKIHEAIVEYTDQEDFKGEVTILVNYVLT